MSDKIVDFLEVVAIGFVAVVAWALLLIKPVYVAYWIGGIITMNLLVRVFERR